MAEMVEVMASEIPSLGTKVGKAGPRGKSNWQGGLFGKIQGQKKNKVGKMERRENKRSSLCVSKWLVNIFVWPNPVPHPCSLPYLLVKICSNFLHEHTFSSVCDMFTNFTSCGIALSYSKESEHVSLKKGKR